MVPGNEVKNIAQGSSESDVLEQPRLTIPREIAIETERRRELDDTEFIAEWFDHVSGFLPLHGPIELLRKRDWRQTFYGKPRT